jgi:ABC-type lipoprotein export system ATPase subunit
MASGEAHDTGIAAMGRDLTRQFVARGETMLALDGVDLDVPRGQLTAISGPSGSGKSTLLGLLGCLDRPTRGVVMVAGREVGQLGRRARRSLRRVAVATMLPQPSDNLVLSRTGLDNIRLAARQRGADTAGAERIVEQLRIGGFVERACLTMSGGEQQRVALACALAGGIPLVLADEPTGALDAVSAAAVIAALVAAAAAGATIVTATHDPNVVAAAGQVVGLEHGRRVA